MTPPRCEERGVRVQMEEAKKADFRSKLSAETRKGRKQKEPKAKTKKKEKDDTLSSAQLHTRNITASSTFAPTFSPLPHTQLSAPSVLVGTPLKPLTPSSPATDSSSLTQKSFNMTSPSSASLSNMSSSSSPSSSSSSSPPPPSSSFLLLLFLHIFSLLH
ncbi:uncharacterized protein MONOS_10598 [Monocercomonoides exilis]|uniref:uncharacterized protein n=1 Tax=Monocercomonoides exilis TaxID=2049356 RepID=UPI00355A90DE|nr:hypothetical protein MONOS_10598 [Monocercomonoides exilis]|eukprot:MONOS_10598.1-p1 / transcript=MONOS_10598.1 / gene=MONOS_10598 / organism=Monocercomonoides_exilis_PA203 / gene_product=unspecified product / transcript_product=unspecified product / location=Mono_scaffold00488:15668-16288(+) / protein_length=160 / sequence_SO=supercontig / SO=protein_coding / is_pseudo=false